MADNKDKKVLNVPALRFPEFSGEWERTTLGKIGDTFNGLTGKRGSDFGHGSPYITYKSIYDNSKIDLSRVEYVQITDDERRKKTQNEVQYGDVFFTTSSETPNEVGMSSVLLDNIKDCYLNSFSFGYRLKSLKITMPEYMRFYLRSQIIRKKMYVLAQGSTRFNISKGEVMGLSIKIPTAEEQNKIAVFLSLIDERISTQNKIIEKLETLIKGIRDYVLNNELQYTTRKKLGELCSITTGKLDANAMKSEGKYPFFTCAEEVYRIDNFAFDTEALLISGNGANLGYIHYYKGKFNAYQRTYVLSDFTADVHYIQIYLEAYLHKRIVLEKSTSNTPYIVLATLTEMPIVIPSIKIQKDISSKILLLKSKLTTESHIRSYYNDMRQFLLSQMFI